jgi:hypothetical protein
MRSLPSVTTWNPQQSPFALVNGDQYGIVPRRAPEQCRVMHRRDVVDVAFEEKYWRIA